MKEFTMMPPRESERSAEASAEFYREYLDYVSFWNELWETHLELAEPLAPRLDQPERDADVGVPDRIGVGCPCCGPDAPVGFWVTEEGIVPATPLGVRRPARELLDRPSRLYDAATGQWLNDEPLGFAARDDAEVERDEASRGTGDGGKSNGELRRRGGCL